MKLHHSFVALGAAILISACSGIGSNYEPTIDAPKDAKYYSDLAACQQLAKTRKYNSSQNAALTAGGAAVGGLVNSKGDRNDILDGAAIGAAAGAAAGGINTTIEQQRIVRNCMIGRGYKVVN